MIRKIFIYAAAALTLVSLCIPLLTTTVIAADGGVKQVTVSVDPKFNPGDTVTIDVTVITGSSTDAWTGTITLNAETVAISGTGSTSESKIFPTEFTGGDTDAIGTYSISVNANIGGQTPVTGTGSFEVKEYYMSVSSSPIVKGGTLTVTIHTTELNWGGIVTVAEPGGSPDTSTYTFSGENGDETTTDCPDTWSGTVTTTTAGVYTLSFAPTSGAADTMTFDVQDASPHAGAGFSTTTYACAGCHRTHADAKGAKLLKGSTQLGLCNSCHDGTGANTNVVSGIYLGSTEGAQDAGLRGGGFTTALMDTDLDGSPTLGPVSSNHTLGTGLPIAWGSGPLGDGDAGEAFTASLECGNCHNPHGNDYYRLLRPLPTGLDDDAPTEGIDEVYVLASYESSKNYTVAYDSNDYRDMGDYPTSVLNLMSDWCGQCHTRYIAGIGGGRGTNRDDAIFKFSHMTDGLGGECLKCHVAHGTSASMDQAAAADDITWPGQSEGYDPAWQGDEDNFSRLLTIDNRGVCIQCHNTDELTGN